MHTLHMYIHEYYGAILLYVGCRFQCDINDWQDVVW